MKIQPAIWAETKKIAAGTLALTMLMIAVFLIIGQFDYTVLLGAVLGCAAAVGNFFLMALTVQKVADGMLALPPEEECAGEDGEEEKERPLSDEARQAGRKMQASYTLRMLMLAGIAALGVALPVFNSWAVLLPMLFPRIVISIIHIAQNRRKEA